MADNSSGGPQHGPPGPLGGEPRLRRPPGTAAPARGLRVATWLVWWALLMALWVAVDDSLAPDELVAGAAAAALAALAAELVGWQAALRFRVRAAWLARAVVLPGQVARDTALVFAALARAVITGNAPPGAFRELPVRYGDDTPLGETRRLLLTGAHSLAPNEFVLGLDQGRDVMVVHQLVEAR
jgi:multisubunit Na+/H+ antiporter MnhE subunit